MRPHYRRTNSLDGAMPCFGDSGVCVKPRQYCGYAINGGRLTNVSMCLSAGVPAFTCPLDRSAVQASSSASLMRDACCSSSRMEKGWWCGGRIVDPCHVIRNSGLSGTYRRPSTSRQGMSSVLEAIRETRGGSTNIRIRAARGRDCSWMKKATTGIAGEQPALASGCTDS